MGEPEEFDHAVGVAGQADIAGSEQAREHRALVLLRGENEIFPHGEFRKDLQKLERAADAQPIEIARTHAGDGSAIEPHLAGARLKLAEDAVEQRRLATAVRPDDAEDLALVHVERYAFDGVNAAELLGKIADFEHGHHATFTSVVGAAGGSVLRAAVKRFSKKPMMPLGLNTSSSITNIA